jgi:hypothetical protein
MWTIFTLPRAHTIASQHPSAMVAMHCISSGACHAKRYRIIFDIQNPFDQHMRLLMHLLQAKRIAHQIKSCSSDLGEDAVGPTSTRSVRRTVGRTVGGTDGRTDGRTDSRTDERSDGRSDGRSDAYRQQTVDNITGCLDGIPDFGPFKSQHLLWNLHLVGWLKLDDVDWEDMKPFISDRATTALMMRFQHPAVEDLSCSPAKKKRKLEADAQPKQPQQTPGAKQQLGF